MKLEEFKANIEIINNKLESRENFSEEFDNLNLLNFEITKRLVTILEKNDNFREKNILEQVIKTNLNDFNTLIYKYQLDDNDIVKFQEILVSFLEEIKRLKYLSIFNKNNTVIVGANGSGKSSLASYLKKSDAEGIIVIPAQKILFFLKKIEASYASELKIRDLEKNDFNNKNHEKDYLVTDKVTALSELFTYYISAIVNDLANAGAERIVNNRECEAIYIKLIQIWKKFYFDIELNYDMSMRKLIPKKNDQIYDINSLSEGEKVTLFYIMVVLFAPKDAYIIVDEPETFLNPSIYNRLWYLLEENRSDCRFIYLSHNLEFISSRTSHEIYWCKKYDGKKNWDIEEISGRMEELPEELVIQLIGSKKNILFCEGNIKSLDYKVYTALFENEVVVIPVGGHRDVINYTKAYNKSNFFEKKAFGIIDRDFHSQEVLMKYKQFGVYSLEFNEIEMFLLDKELIEYVLKGDYDSNFIDSAIQKFQDEVIKEIKDRKNHIINKGIKFFIDETNFTVDIKTDDLNSINERIKEYFNKSIDDSQIEKKINELNSKIDDLIEKNNYEEALQVSDFKNLFNHKTKEIFGMNYNVICINKIMMNRDLRIRLRDNHFSELSKQLFDNH